MDVKTQSTKRNYGIDLLRLVAAFYVIILHTLLQGGLFSATVLNSYQNTVCHMLLIFSFCAVNIFGIISGYVGYREGARKFSFTGYLSLWIDVVFYGVILTLIFMYLRPNNVVAANLLRSLFPVTKHLYWYFSAYTLVYFLAPFLNRMVSGCSDRALKYLFFLICAVIVPLEFVGDCFSIGRGYTSLWLILLYIIGAIMKKTGLGSNIRPLAALLSIIAINACLFFLVTKYPQVIFLNFAVTFSYELRETYVSPVFVGSAILYVILFSQIHINSFARKIITFAAPAAFYVYIINVPEHVWFFFMNNRFAVWPR